ncbi:MAG: S8 family serine peptidase [Verrucomicrobia bacterium]|nr:S8 family serine peptidase [Verrucomicrobiota bacterium]
MNQLRPARLWLAASLALVALGLVWLERQRTVDSTQSIETRGQFAATPKSQPPSGATAWQDDKDSLLKRLRHRVEAAGGKEGEALLKFKSAEAMNAFLKRAQRHGLRVLGRLDGLRAMRVGYDRLEQLRDAVAEDPDALDDIGGNYIVRIPDFLQQEDRPAGAGSASFNGNGFLRAIHATGDRSSWGQGVTVAVVDTGVENHPTFDNGQITHYDLVNDGKPFDGHGTAMASLIAGQDSDAPGVAPAAHILDVRVADGDGYSSSFKLAEGIVQAADAGAKVINISLGSYGDSQAVRDAVAYAQGKGAVVVGAAGNDATSNLLEYPAAISSVVSVGGVDAKLQQAYYSNSGQGLDVAAPGVGIQSAYGKDSIVEGDGTSQATAITSGALAAGISTGATTSWGAADWLKQNVLHLELPPERGGAGMVQAPAK